MQEGRRLRNCYTQEYKYILSTVRTAVYFIKVSDSTSGKIKFKVNSRFVCGCADEVPQVCTAVLAVVNVAAVVSQIFRVVPVVQSAERTRSNYP